MGRILEYVVLLSNVSLILGVQQYLRPSQGVNYERENGENFTHAIKQYLPTTQNDFFNKKLLPLGPPLRRRSPPLKQRMLNSPGLHSYSSDNALRRNSSHQNGKNVLPPHSQALYTRRNPKNSFPQYFPSQKLSRLIQKPSSTAEPNKRADNFNRRYAGRNHRYQPWHSAKVCDACNSVPWVPLLKVPDSYRQHRAQNHITELHPTPQQNFNFDYHGFASSSHNVLLPPAPLPPPAFDGTISSSFGLPVGNIPTSHGLLAPISTIDYSNSFNYYYPHGLLENNNFPELSPVPIVPIHDSGQFYQFDSSIPDLVPPPTKPVDVSKVVLTISEEQKPPNPLPSNHKHASVDLTSASTAVDSSHTRSKEQNKDFTKLEIVKSIPLAEFTSQQLPLYPPLQSEFPNNFLSQKNHLQQNHLQQNHLQQNHFQQSASNSDFLVPPPVNKVEHDLSLSSNKTLEAEASAPKPLTSPSLSWLFSDHTAPPAESKSTASVTSFTADAQEIASVVNNELRPVSPQPLVSPSDVGGSKGKKIQIIIPYTTKSKSGHDNNALESVQHEVFQSPTSKSTIGNSSPHDFATSVLPPSTESPTEGRTVIDDGDDERTHKYLSEMQHIIASNIRELLREEIDNSQKEQNSLQNNIDNWTALEYSNHKTVGTKAPKEIIAQALAVTSIPGTSISHLLLPSKKIPNEYFVTTPLPVYDEPSGAVYKTGNTTVHSRPFTAKPYATTNVYNPTKGPSSVSLSQVNHEKNYTEVERARVNAWGRLNENLVLPEARNRRPIQHTTPSTWRTSRGEKVEIVTPISVTSQRNLTITPIRRTTRHARTTESPTTPGNVTTKAVFLNKLNSTKLEKVSNQTSPFNRYNSTKEGVPNGTNSTVSDEEKTVTESPGKETEVSINDIFPFRNKELPWESRHNRSETELRIGRQRKSLIKQVNLQRAKTASGSS